MLVISVDQLRLSNYTSNLGVQIFLTNIMANSPQITLYAPITIHMTTKWPTRGIASLISYIHPTIYPIGSIKLFATELHMYSGRRNLKVEILLILIHSYSLSLSLSGEREICTERERE